MRDPIHLVSRVSAPGTNGETLLVCHVHITSRFLIQELICYSFVKRKTVLLGKIECKTSGKK